MLARVKALTLAIGIVVMARAEAVDPPTASPLQDSALVYADPAFSNHAIAW
jgi:hypothetical protein